MSDKGHIKDSGALKTSRNGADISDFVLEKTIFSNIFEKDIRRVYIYKKAERLAKAIHLVGPAFTDSRALKERLDRIAVGLVDAAILSPTASKDALSRELLALSSILSIARTGGILSPMNADLIVKESHQLLEEVIGYEEPRLGLEEVPSLATLSKLLPQGTDAREANRLRSIARVMYEPGFDAESTPDSKEQSKGHVKDTASPPARQSSPAAQNSSRRDSILAVLRSKGPSYIKDISLIVRDVSEKTIQRELATLVSEGLVEKKGDRRWTTYELATQVD